MNKSLLTIMLISGILSNLSANILEEIEKACDIGDPGACYHLGNIYKEGKIVQRDLTRANKFYTKSCNGGDAKGCYQLGLVYEKGPKQNYYMAKEFHTKACNGGDDKACAKLGFIYKEGLGVGANHTKAKDFFRKACDGSNTIGCYEYKRIKAKK